MTNGPSPVRQKLSDTFNLDRPEIVSEQVSVDGTRKWLFRFRDPANPNMRRSRSRPSIFPRATAARSVSRPRWGVPSLFVCHTGTQKLVRNLTAGEILGQIRWRASAWAIFPAAAAPMTVASCPAGKPAPSQYS